MANKDYVSDEEYVRLWEALKGTVFVSKKTKLISVISIIVFYVLLTVVFVIGLRYVVRLFI